MDSGGLAICSLGPARASRSVLSSTSRCPSSLRWTRVHLTSTTYFHPVHVPALHTACLQTWATRPLVLARASASLCSNCRCPSSSGLTSARATSESCHPMRVRHRHGGQLLKHRSRWHLQVFVHRHESHGDISGYNMFFGASKSVTRSANQQQPVPIFGGRPVCSPSLPAWHVSIRFWYQPCVRRDRIGTHWLSVFQLLQPWPARPCQRSM